MLPSGASTRAAHRPCRRRSRAPSCAGRPRWSRRRGTSSSPRSITSIVPRWCSNIGAVIRYWNRRWVWSISRISSGIGRPVPVVITRVLPSTVQSTMPGNQVVQLGGVARQRPHVGGAALDPDLVAEGAVHQPSPGGAGDEVDDHGGELGALVLLQEVAAADDRGVRLALLRRGCAAWNGPSPPLVTASWSLNAHSHGLRNCSSTSHAARVVGARRVVGHARHERREDARAGLVAVVGERCVVGGDHLGAEIGGAAAVDDAADREHRRLARELLPVEERLAEVAVAHRQAGVADDHARVALGRRGDQPEPDEAAPVLTEERDAA